MATDNLVDPIGELGDQQEIGDRAGVFALVLHCRFVGIFQDKNPIGSSNRRPRRVHSPPGAPGAPGVAREDEDPEELPAAPAVVDDGAGAVVALLHHKRKMK